LEKLHHPARSVQHLAQALDQMGIRAREAVPA
jgi:hypothetical protein